MEQEFGSISLIIGSVSIAFSFPLPVMTLVGGANPVSSGANIVAIVLIIISFGLPASAIISGIAGIIKDNRKWKAIGGFFLGILAVIVVVFIFSLGPDPFIVN